MSATTFQQDALEDVRLRDEMMHTVRTKFLRKNLSLRWKDDVLHLYNKETPILYVEETFRWGLGTEEGWPIKDEEGGGIYYPMDIGTVLWFINCAKLQD